MHGTMNVKSMFPVTLKSDFSCVEQFLNYFLHSIEYEVL